MNIDGYYKGYLALHRDPRNQMMHVIGQLATLLWVGGCVLTAQWWWLAAAPLVVYPFAWFGHFVYEGNRPAAWRHPIKAKVCDWLMFRDYFMGRLP